MRENGTVGEKNPASDAKVWEIVAHIRELQRRGFSPDHEQITKLLDELKEDHNFIWNPNTDRGTYSGSGVTYDQDRQVVSDGLGANAGSQPSSDERGWAQRAPNGSNSNDPFAADDWGEKFLNKTLGAIDQMQKNAHPGNTKDDNKNTKWAGMKNRGSAFAYYKDQFRMLGLPEDFMDQDIKDLIRTSPSAKAVLVGLRDTDEWKARFSGNEQRIKNGFLPLPEAEYVAAERGYEETLKRNGLPPGFYDSKEDFANFIGNNISVEQVQERATIAGELIQTKRNPQLWAELKSRGIAKGDAAAYILDPDRALPQIERKIGASKIGAAMRPAGLELKKNRKFENSLYDKGITEDQAKEASQVVASEDKDWEMLAGGEVSDKKQMKDQLGIGGKKVRKWKDKKKKLASEMRAKANTGTGGATMFGNNQL